MPAGTSYYSQQIAGVSNKIRPLARIRPAASFDWRDTQVLAYLLRQSIAYLGVPWYSGSLVQQGIVPPRMANSLPDKLAATGMEIAQKLAALHMAIFSSSNSVPAASKASCLLNPNASRRVIFKVSSSSLRERSWQFTPGTSSIQPIQKSRSFFTTAV